jgi:hypothetical protein
MCRIGFARFIFFVSDLLTLLYLCLPFFILYYNSLLSHTVSQLLAEIDGLAGGAGQAAEGGEQPGLPDVFLVGEC